MDGFPQDQIPDALLTLADVRRSGELGEPHRLDTTLAETGSALLQVAKVAVLVQHPDGSLSNGCDVGVSGDRRLESCARELACAAFEAGEPVFIPNVRVHSSSLATRLADSSIESAVCVPHISDTGSESSAVVVMNDEPRAFTHSDIGVLHVLAAQAVADLRTGDGRLDSAEPGSYREALVHLAHRKIRELSAVNKVSHAVSSTLDMDELFRVALDQCMAAVGADVGSLMLVSDATKKLEIVSSRGLARKWIEETSLPVGASIAGWVARNGLSVLVSDARADKRFEMPSYRDDINSAASVPLITSAKVIGVLNVNTTSEGRHYDERDLQLLETIANQVAVAIENATLYARVHRRTTELDTLLQVSKTITATLYLDEVLARLSGQIRRVFQMEVCAILLVDDLSDRFRFSYGSGLKTVRRSGYLDAALPLASRVKRTNRPVMMEDISTNRLLRTAVSQAERLVSAVAIPLRNDRRIVAVAVGFSRHRRVFPDSVRKIMRPLSELAGVAVHNARVFRQKYRLAEMMRRRFAPAYVPEIESFDFGLKLLPAREVGGDYCDFIVGENGLVTLVLSDVAGSDVEAAECALTARHVVRAYAKVIDSPASTLAWANTHLYDETGAEAFVSLFIGRLDSIKGTLTYSCAGCEPAVAYRPRDGSTRILHSPGILLGIMPDAEFSQETVALESGDVIAIFSDGVTETGSRRERFGYERVAGILEAHEEQPAQDIADAICDAVLDFGGGRAMDDVAIMVVKAL